MPLTFPRISLRLCIFILCLSNILFVHATKKHSRPATTGSSIPKRQNSCTTVKRRREWRRLSRAQQESYLDAVKCLATRPSVFSGNQFNLRRYDDFQFVHASLYLQVHFTARFLPWHRHLLYLYERALSHCNYTAGIPRWDWTLDSRDASQAPVWSSDPRSGFGGNGTGPVDPNLPEDGGAVMDGAFSNFELRHPIPHLLHRKWDPLPSFSPEGTIYLGEFYDKDTIDNILSQRNFSTFHPAIEGQNPQLYPEAMLTPHSAPHVWIGGEMPSSIYAANDPIFFLHHANIDWLWERWQAADSARRRDYVGTNTRSSRATDARITDRLPFLGLDGPDPTVADTMNPRVFPYCYRY